MAKVTKWKSLLATTESDVNKSAHKQGDAEQSAKLKTWTAYGNLEKDPLTPLLGRPIEVLRVFKLSDANALAALAKFPNLKTVWFDACQVDAKLLVAAARAVSTLEVLMLRGPGGRSAGTLGAADLAGLTKLKAIELRGATLEDAGIDALFSTRSLSEASLSRTGSETQKRVTIEDQPELRRLDLNLSAGTLKLANLPQLAEVSFGGSFDDLTLEGLPLVTTLELPIGDRASLKDVGATEIVASGLSTFELSGAPQLKKLDLRDCEDTLDEKRIAALRKAFPKAKVLPA